MSVNLHDTTDAQVWVDEWLKTIKQKPSIPNDEGTMLGWFANAIMAGFDAGQRAAQQRVKSDPPSAQVSAGEKSR